jgi:hypothetical protein
MIDNEAQDKIHNTFVDRTQERLEGCIILEMHIKSMSPSDISQIQFSTILHI